MSGNTAKMPDSSWQNWHECAIKEQGRKERQLPTASKANVPDKEVTHMPFEHDYGDSTPESNPEILTFDYQTLRGDLAKSGWRTPQCYSKEFDAPGDFSAVYAFLLVDPWEFKRARPAYVGMSKNISQRWSGHPILAELEDLGPWVQKWFIRVDECELRSVEAENISRFDPPWNVIGRKRGVAAL